MKYQIALLMRVCAGRSPCGERGLKSFNDLSKPFKATRRSPCGERGLKYLLGNHFNNKLLSLPVRGAWIEILR